VELEPKNAMALNARGGVLYKQGKIDQALFDLNRAVRYAPRLSLAYNNRGVCLVAKQEYEKAIADYNQFLKLNPESPIAIANRGVALMGKGDFKAAKSDLEAAVKLAPKVSEGLNSLAWFLATCPEDQYRDGEQAIVHAKAACEASNWKNWSYIGTLSVAKAETGKFEEAIELANQARGMAPAEEQPEFDAKIELFKSGQPYHSKIGKSSEQKPGGSP
jgi:tetratricopeptide (TPR) repeat protein